MCPPFDLLIPESLDDILALDVPQPTREHRLFVGLGGPMPLFRVKLYDGADKPKGEHREVTAPSPLAAAEQFCGKGTLRDGGKPGQLQAEVSLMSGPGKKHTFYKVP